MAAIRSAFPELCALLTARQSSVMYDEGCIQVRVRRAVHNTCGDTSAYNTARTQHDMHDILICVVI